MSTLAERFFVSGGTLPLNSGSYIERACDEQLFKALLAGKYCYVLNTRQMGKSSLCVRTKARLESKGVQTIFIDLTRVGGRNNTAEQWYAGLVVETTREMNLTTEAMRYWSAHQEVGPMSRFFGVIRDVLLVSTEAPIVILIDEIDATRNLPFDADEFYAGIRECFNRRVQDETLRRLCFCLLGVAVPSDLIRNPVLTPFNVGERIALSDFTMDELMQFAPALGPNGSELVKRVHFWTNGHPFLSQTICEAIAACGAATSHEVDTIVQTTLFEPRARTTNINLADVANRALHSGDQEVDPVRFRSNLLSMYERILQRRTIKDDEANRVAVLLKLSGIVRSDQHRLYPRNRIYQHVFDRAWIRDNMPGQELRRQALSYRRGLIIASSIAAFILIFVGSAALLAWQSGREAERARLALDYQLYVSDINSLRLYEQIGDVARIEAVLNRTEDSPHRGFEWAFWHSRIHDANEEYTLDYNAPGKRSDGLLSFDGKHVLLSDPLTQTVSVVDRQRNTLVATRHVGPNDHVVPTPHAILATVPDGQRVHVVDLITGQRRVTLEPPLSRLSMFVTAPHSRYAYAAYANANDTPDDLLVLWDLETGAIVWELRLTFVAQSGLSRYSLDGKKVLIVKRAPMHSPGPTTVTLQAFDTSTNKIVDRFQASDDSLVLKISPDGRYVAYRDATNVFRVRDMESQSTITLPIEVAGNKPRSFTFDSSGKYLAIVDTGGVMRVTSVSDQTRIAEVRNVWTVAPGITPLEIVASTTSTRIYDFSEDGQHALPLGYRVTRAGPNEVNVFLRDPASVRILSDPDYETKRINMAAPNTRSPTYNGRWLVHQRPDADYFQDIEGKTKPLKLPIRAPFFASGLRSTVIGACLGRKLYGISGESGKILWEKSSQADVYGIWVSPDSKYLFCVEEPTHVRVIEALTGKELPPLSGHNVRLTNLCFPRQGNTFFTCGADGRAVLWEMESRRKIAEFKSNAGQRLTSADLSPDGTRVVTSDEAGAWQLWNASDGAQLMEVVASDRPLNSALFSADGKTVLTAGEDRILRTWNSQMGVGAIRIPLPPDALRNISK